MRLITLQAENFKRLKAARVTPTGPVTPIIGANGAGKTSVLDSLAAALGGTRLCPEVPIRTGEDTAQVTVDLEEIKVRRRWTAKGSTLEVFSADGGKLASPQAVLDALLGPIAFNPLAFLRQKPAEQAATLAKVAGIDLDGYARRRKATFDQRTELNREAKKVAAQIAGLPTFNAPDEEINAAAVLAQLKNAQEHNATRKRGETRLDQINRDVEQTTSVIADLESKLTYQRERLGDMVAEAAKVSAYLDKMSPPVDTVPIERQLAEADETNRRVRVNKDRAVKQADLAELTAATERLTDELDQLDRERDQNVANAPLPLAGLALTDAAVTLNGLPLSQASGAEQLRLSVGIALALNSQLRLMLIPDGSLLDANGMKLLAEMAEAADAQVLIEQVDHGQEIGVRIVDGATAE